ncbi:MAG: PGPGW domain-containing protein, partial [Acidimicrobiales bacterium]|nr:PGPGW domain-containing protein [Acidimicrobiales bacterium]
LAMLVLPGQGIITVIIGLTILARELPWAARMLEYAKRKAKVDELKQQPIWVKAVAWGFTALAIAASGWYLFLADPKPTLADVLPWNWG